MRIPAALALALLIAAALVVVPACSSDVGAGLRSRNPRQVPLGYDVPGQGFDAGVAATAAFAERALAGAAIPRPGGGVDMLVAFVAFTTTAPADDADGNGTALDRTAPAATDSNGASDVFLAAVIDLERIVNNQPRPAAFVQGLAPIFRDPRCIRCHSFHYPGGWRENGHVGNLPKGSNDGCRECHSSSAVLLPGMTPNQITWLGPDAAQTRNPTQDFRGKSDRELYDLVFTEPEPADHLKNDDKILWAIQHGQVPFHGPAVGGRVPLDPQLWQDLIDAWALNGSFLFSTDSATQDLVLVSRAAGGTAAGAGASTAPAISFEPNPAFNPTNPTAAPAGWVFVAFASTATDLIAGNTVTARDVYRSRVEVWVNPDQTLDLRADATTNVLVTRSTSDPTHGGDADSGAPSISADGNLVAFESLASDLVVGFTDGNGATAPDVYLRDVFNGTIALYSPAFGGAASSGGDGASLRPAISATGGAVAFESDATNLIAADGNGVRDVFHARNPGGGLVVARASVANGGGEAGGGASTAASVWVDPGTDEVWVAFTSSKSGLDPMAAAGVAPGVFLHRAAPSLTTVRLTRGSTAAARDAVITPDGGRVVFTSAGADLDPLRTDANGVDDVFSFDFTALRSGGTFATQRLSLAITGADGDAASDTPRVGAFRTFVGDFGVDQLLAFRTGAGNLGLAPGGDAVLQFLIDRTNPRTTAQFNAAPRMGTLPLPVQFTDLSSNASTWSWTFGDGGVSSMQNPSHTYTTAGDFDVTLTVTGVGGTDTLTKPGFISVTATPPTWTEVYTTYFTGCSSCHTLAQNSSRFAMSPQSTAYNNLVGISSVVCAGRTRVVAGNSTLSQIMEVLSGTGCHTTHTGGTVGPQALADLRAWIDAGALNN